MKNGVINNKGKRPGLPLLIEFFELPIIIGSVKKWTKLKIIAVIIRLRT